MLLTTRVRRIFLAMYKVDMRKGHDGLLAEAFKMGLDPYMGDLVIFVGRGFGVFIRQFPTYTLIYGALAALPLFLVWIYVSWMITLVGAVLAAALPIIKYERWWHQPLPGSAFVDAMAVLLPVSCAGCGEADRALCGACRGQLAPEPVLRSLDDGTPVWAALAYDGVVRRVILGLKEQGRTDVARALAVSFASAVNCASSIQPL